MSRRFIGALLGLATLAACSDRDPLIPANDPAATVSAHERPALEVKFRAALEVRPGEDGLTSASGARLDALMSLLDPAAGVQTTPLFTAEALALDEVAEAQAAQQGEAAPDLASWYRVALPAGADVERFLVELRARPEVEHAYTAPVPAPPPGFVSYFASSTPDFTGMQGYLGAPPMGTDAAWARTLPGGDGAGVMVVDLEYDWHLGHEDLTLPPSAQIGTGARYTGFGNHHGTAVLGELAGRANGFGVTGGVPGADIRVIPPIYGAGSYIPANAIAEAAAVMAAGDVLLIEQQTTGPTGVYVPLEAIQSVFDATRSATLAGRIVVAAAGNGGQDLDATGMNNLFNRHLRDSGAIIVGAGSALHARLSFSCYGSRVDVQGWGQGVTTTGYGWLYGTGMNDYYTNGFSGTSSASPIVTAAAAAVQGRRKARGLPVLTSVQMRDLLRDTGTPQTGDTTQIIGPFPNLRAALGELAAPGVPGGVTLGLLSATSARLSWTVGLDSVTHFQVGRRVQNADSTWSDWATIASPGGGDRFYDDTGLTAGRTYRHRVRACYDASCSGWAQSGLIKMAAPPAPSNLAAGAISGTQLRVSWMDGSGNETGFRLERGRRLEDRTWTAFQPVATRGANATTHVDSGLVAGATYRYRINACNPAGCSAWVMGLPVATPVVPAAPTGVGAAVVTPTRIRVTWTDASSNETNFSVNRRTRNGDGSWGPWVQRGTPRADVTSAVDSVGPGTHQYRVRACNGPVCSAYVLGAQVVLSTQPAMPTGIGAVALSSTSAQVTWTDASGNETLFSVQRRLRNLDGTWQAWTGAGTVPAGSTAFGDGGLLPDRTYEFRVAACAGPVCSAWTPAARVRLPAS